MIKLIFPCDYVGITQGFKSSHKAIDMGWSTKDGGPNHVIYAPYDGVVTYVKDSIKGNDKSKKTYGNYIKIRRAKIHPAIVLQHNLPENLFVQAWIDIFYRFQLLK